jgi:RHS repeat-associated protein
VESGIRYTLRGLSGQVLREYFELNGSWSWVKDHIWAGGELIATVEPSGIKHLHRDHLGSVRVETASNGALLTTHSYWPFGEEMTVTSSSERYRFAGHERDQRTGYDYMHARYYAPMAGRFFSVDPGRDYDFSHPQSFNLYGYVRNNPVTFVDKDGRAVLPAVVGAVVGPYLAKVGAQALGGGLGSLAAACTFYALDRTQANKPALGRWFMTSGASAFFKGALAAGADALVAPVRLFKVLSAGPVAGAATSGALTKGDPEEKMSARVGYLAGRAVAALATIARELNPGSAFMTGFFTTYSSGLIAEAVEKGFNTANTLQNDARGAAPDLKTRVETTQELMEDPEFKKEHLVKVRDQDNPAHPQ